MVTSQHKLILSSGRFSGTSRQQLAEAFAAFESSPRKDRLVLHFHGGLVGESDAEAIALRLLPHYRDEGQGYPLFTIWQAGLWETLRNNWQEIVEQDVFPRLVERVLQFVWGKLDQAPGEKGGEVELPTRFKVQDQIRAAAAGHDPLADREDEADSLDPQLTAAEERQFKDLLESDPLLARAADNLVDDEQVELSPELQRDVEAARKAATPGEKGLIETAMLARAGLRILGRVLVRFHGKRGHGIYTTIVEETARELKGDLVGGIVWKHLKKDTADSFAGPATTHGGSALLEEIRNLHARGHRPRIVLVGHSTGAVYVCHLLQAAKARLPDDLRFDVILLAPACTFELLRDTIDRAGDRFASLRSFAMEDKLEKTDRLLPPFYVRSLLYFVSGVVEEDVDMPLVGMKRFHDGKAPFTAEDFPDIARVREFAARFSRPWIWSKSELGPGLGTLSEHHGDFDNDATTLASVTHLIVNGFA